MFRGLMLLFMVMARSTVTESCSSASGAKRSANRNAASAVAQLARAKSSLLMASPRRYVTRRYRSINACMYMLGSPGTNKHILAS